MVASQRHRGPDAEGIYLDPSGTAALGHNRLSIIDLSSAGTQPMWDPSGRYAIVFNGEIYNYLELRHEFPDHLFRSSSDTEVLLLAYERWGGACLEHLIGMFAFVIWDARERRVFGARDRFRLWYDCSRSKKRRLPWPNRVRVDCWQTGSRMFPERQRFFWREM